MISIDLPQGLGLGVLVAAAHWLVARSTIARPLWSRARGWLGELLACAGCSGWWLGLGAGIGGLRPVHTGWTPADVVASGLGAVFLTPVLEGVMLWGLAMSAISHEDPQAVRNENGSGDE